ncbi:MAG TPA: 3-dehydroquinate synthase family protein, partial [Candidatus Deferrimicrobium sp.]|nr:3-dehydroquinate synthase family protein [Candidatus Deferrimicrobium sp.]
MQVVKVNLGTRAYPVVIGPGALAYAGRCLKLLSRSRRVFMFCDAQVFALHRHSLRAAFKRSGVTTEEMVVPIGEQAKSRAVVNRMHDFLLDKKISRTDFILACGGGVTSDVVGYAAATVLRGVPWGIISTTLLGMVDAAIGGKTGINHPRGKNLIGCFYQPTFVVCDTDFLNTLEDRQSIAGAGEIVKYGGLIGDKMLTVIDRFLAQNNWRHERL